MYVTKLYWSEREGRFNNFKGKHGEERDRDKAKAEHPRGVGESV